MGHSMQDAKEEESKNYDDLEIPEFRMSKQIAANNDAAANEEEVEEQIEQDNVKKTARDNATGASTPIMTTLEMAINDDSLSANEEVQEQAERKRVEQEAFENRISAASAEKWMRNGSFHD
jgi:hypothetical protein